MNEEYKRNHYVPEWYQRRFFLPAPSANEFYYLDFKPKHFLDSKGGVHFDNAIKRQGARCCFVEDDLYTTSLGSTPNKDIEKYFFGDIDSKGRRAVEYFSDFDHLKIDGEAFQDMVMHMSTQKLRTPKGLDWIAKKENTTNQSTILRCMVKLRQLHCAVWTECIWLIADASKSQTKFIVSDHPVTVYNRVCGPRSDRCRGSNDPEIWLNGTHTIFPLSLEKALILTNLSWVRNPYQSELSMRPNPSPFRSTIFNFQDVQTLRFLDEQEVIEMNYIIKRRAYRYVAAAKEEWLFPEKNVTTIKWNEFGGGYLLMPDPRAVYLGGQIIIGHSDGTASGFDAYGRRPWEPDYSREEKLHEEDTLYRFQGEFARLFGPYRRGRAFCAMQLDKERDDDEFHKYHLGLE